MTAQGDPTADTHADRSADDGHADETTGEIPLDPTETSKSADSLDDTGTNGRVVDLYLTPETSGQMRQQTHVELVGAGIVGDRYCTGDGHFALDGCAVTLIAREAIEYVATEHGIDLTGGQHRRNIVTEGVDLRRLLDAEVRLGTATVRGTRPRPPCAHLEETAETPGIASALDGRAGICAKVTDPGTVEVGDQSAIVSPDPETAGKMIAERLREETRPDGDRAQGHPSHE